MVRHADSARAAADRWPGRTFLSAALFVAGLVGVAVLWAAWPRTSNTSPLAALFASAWSCTYLAAALLTWRGSRLAPAVFAPAMALLLPVFSFIFPGNWMLAAPALTTTVIVALIAYRYLHRHVANGSGRAL